MKTKLKVGMYFDDDHPIQDAHEVEVYEDDHGIVIDIDPDKHIRIDPQDFPELIELMANTMIGMVNY